MSEDEQSIMGVNKSNYVICIPSYRRANFCNEKTLSTLQKHNIDSKSIFVYVANKEEYDTYKNVLNPSLYNKLVIGKKGLVPQRQFIMEQWPTNKHIVFMDDDVESIDLSLSPMFKKHSLDHFIKKAFETCVQHKSFIWGVYPVFNPFFRKPRPELSTDLKYIVGAFYGIINRPSLNSLKLTITKLNGQKEDVERTIKYFIHDRIVLRFNKIGFTTKYYGKEGGLGRFEERLKPMKEACDRLQAKYPEYGKMKIRGNGMAEFVLNKIKAVNNNESEVLKQSIVSISKSRKSDKLTNNKKTIKKRKASRNNRRTKNNRKTNNKRKTRKNS
jgi:hypothetical protein